MSAQHGGSGRGFAGAAQGFATILAFIVTVFAAPHVWPLVEAAAWRWLNQLYGPAAASWLHLGDMVASYPLTFLAVRLGVMAIFATLSVFIAKRLM